MNTIKTFEVQFMVAKTDTGPSSAVRIPYKGERTIQVTLSKLGATDVTSEVAIEVSNDGIGWCLLANANLDTAGDNSEGLAVTAPWKYIRGNIISIDAEASVSAVMVGNKRNEDD